MYQLRRPPFSRRLILAVGLLCLFATPLAAQSYIPPIGIPAPDFGIEEKWQDFYSRPNPWNQETEGWYFINQYHENASDNNTYGTPGNPRRTLPATIPAGSVVEIHGDYDFAPTGYDVVQTEGTKEQPVFIIGGEQPRVLRKWVFKSSYTIVENIEFTERGKITVVFPTHHLSIRHNALHNMPGKIGGYGKSDTERIHHIVIYKNQIHSQEGWDANPEIDLDNHGIKLSPYAEDVWVLENLAYNNGGSFIQVGDWNNPADNQKVRRFYIGRNTAYANRQSPIGLKQTSDVIISENHLFNNYAVQTNAAGQSGIVFQYGTGNVWIINNRIHSSNSGITAGSNSGGIGENQYIIGNLIYDIRVKEGYDYNTASAWAPAAIMMAGGKNRYIINNTIFDADGGIHCPGGGKMVISGNIVHTVNKGYHVFIENGNTAAASTLQNNILFQGSGAIKIRWGSRSELTVAEFETQFSDRGKDNLENDPAFADTAAADFRLSNNSPAIDSGRLSEVYQIFYDLYGLDISSDINGMQRPHGNGWDIGACEFNQVSGVADAQTSGGILRDMRLYPNPAASHIRFDLNGTAQSYRIIDLLGRVVRAQDRPAGTQISLRGLPAGIYFLEVRSDRAVRRMRFIKR